ncbi:MAG: glycoside hydrolase family 3 C-terminal domain-containing protein [Bacteroidales bacterium]|nr:glycoside hydrolase family 3 C-terminal domain-containing protein [Bacteroidales bacterium]
MCMKPYFKLLFSGISAAILLAACNPGSDKATGAYATPAIPQDKEIEANVEKLLNKMTLDEKVGQMVQITVDRVMRGTQVDEERLQEVIGTYKVGSLLNVIGGRAQTAAYTAEVVRRYQEVSMEQIGIPCIYGLDMIHGATYLSDGVFFPQEINIAASFNRDNARNMGVALAYETRASMTPWVFSPVMDLGRDARWSRGWESWGEDPYLSAQMAREVTIADQGTDPNHIPVDKVAACAKHYMAYGIPLTGKDRTPAYTSVQELRERYFAPFKESIRAGALSVMVNSASINGVPMHANKELLTGWLKEGLNWDGMIVTDWADVNNLYSREHVAADKVEALALAINAGIDMIMDPYDVNCCTDIKTAVERGLIPMSRIDDAVRRVLRLKYRLDLFEHPVWDVSGFEMGRADFKAQALQAAIESEVLLKNEDGILPLKQGTRILVTGPNGNSMRSLNGGWSYTWQGSDTKEFAQANTIYEALANKFGESRVRYVPGVSYKPGGDWEAEDASGILLAAAAALVSDVIVCCIGENSYCETPGNMNDLNLSENQKNLIRALARTGKPIILVLNEGRPRILGDIEPLADAVIDVFLPSNYGGDALAELLAGDANFSAKMPITYPKYINALHTYDYKVSENVSTMEGEYNYDAKMDVQWEFGYGLSYTTFAYSDLKVVGPTEFTADDVLTFNVTVTNTGNRAGKEAVLLYSSDLVASMVPDNRRLRAFEKISLEPGQSKVVEFQIPASSLAFVGQDGKWRLEEGDFRISVGNQFAMVKCSATKVWNHQNID